MCIYVVVRRLRCLQVDVKYKHEVRACKSANIFLRPWPILTINAKAYIRFYFQFTLWRQPDFGMNSFFFQPRVYGLLMCMWQQCDIISPCLSLISCLYIAWSSQLIFTYISVLTMHLLYASDGCGYPLSDLLHDVYRPINDQRALRSDARQQRTRRACVRNLW